MIPMFTKFISI